MADERPTYKPNAEAQALIEQIQAAYPLHVSGVSDAINYALRFTVQNDSQIQHQEASEMNAVRQIVYQFAEDDAAMFGGDADLSTTDVPASYRRYQDQVRAALESAYPDAQVAVQTGPDRVTVNGDTDHPEVPAVQDIVHREWEAFDWVVESS